MERARTIYRLTVCFPGEERFGLVSQMRRAAVSIPSSLAEGAARSSNNAFRNFLSVARSSLSERGTQLDLSEQPGFMTKHSRSEAARPMTRADKMLYALHRSKSVRAITSVRS